METNRNEAGAAMELTITIPKTHPRKWVLRQLGACQGGLQWHFCTNVRPKRQVDRLNFIHAGDLIGSLPVVAIAELDGPRTLRRPDGSLFTSTRRFAIQAGGRFRPQQPPVRFKSHRGWRYFDHACCACDGLGCSSVTNDDAVPCETCKGSGWI